MAELLSGCQHKILEVGLTGVNFQIHILSATKIISGARSFGIAIHLRRYKVTQRPATHRNFMTELLSGYRQKILEVDLSTLNLQIRMHIEISRNNTFRIRQSSTSCIARPSRTQTTNSIIMPYDGATIHVGFNYAKLLW